MKTALAVLLLILIGLGLGLGVSHWRIAAAPWDSAPYENGGTARGNVPSNQPAPKAFLEKTDYNFGALDITGEGTHDFIVANRGRAPLQLTVGETSCRCAVSKLERDKLAPGESAKITIHWKPKGAIGPYQQTAKINTNDPERPVIVLVVSGTITVAAQFVPPELTFSQIVVGGSATAQARFYCNLEKPLGILSHSWENAETAAYFDVALSPLSAEEVRQQPEARSGTLVAVTVKPGLPQGPFRQKLILRTDLKSAARQMLPIQGAIASEINIIGAGWDYNHNILNIGAVSKGEGATRRLLLIVRGADRNHVTFKVARTTPNFLKARLGEPKAINQGAVVQTPLTVEVPPGSPAADYLDSNQGQYGEIELETTHPSVPKLRVFVRFAVEG